MEFLPDDDLHIFHIHFITPGAFGTHAQGFDVGQQLAGAKREQHWRHLGSLQNGNNHIRAWSH